MEDERVLTRQGLERKAALLHHAERLFAERGFAETRMVDIAEAAGVTKGNVYWYFETKEALAREIAIDARERLRKAQWDACGHLQKPLDIIYVGTVATVRFNLTESPLFGPVSSITDPGFQEVVRESSATHASDTVRILEIGQRDGTIRADDDAFALAQASEGMITHLCVAVLRRQIDGVENAAHIAARFNTRAVASSSDLAESTIERMVAETAPA